MTTNQIAFLEGLARLTRETEVAIAGCGCCGSPYLWDVDPARIQAESGYVMRSEGEEIEWLSPADGAEWNHNERTVYTGEKMNDKEKQQDIGKAVWGVPEWLVEAVEKNLAIKLPGGLQALTVAATNKSYIEVEIKAVPSPADFSGEVYP